MILYLFHLQISTGYQQTPYSILIAVKLVKNNLFIKVNDNFLILQQILHIHFHFCWSRLYQSVNQTIRTGRCPIGTKALLIQIISDWPWIVDISAGTKCTSKQFQCWCYFLLRKSKARAIFIRRSSHYIQVIQIWKYRFLGYPGNSCHNAAFQILIGFKSGIKQISNKRCEFIPITMYISFLHRCIIFIK